jgi:hypothetical protein
VFQSFGLVGLLALADRTVLPSALAVSELNRARFAGGSAA